MCVCVCVYVCVCNVHRYSKYRHHDDLRFLLVLTPPPPLRSLVFVFSETGLCYCSPRKSARARTTACAAYAIASRGSGPGSRATIDVCVPIAIMIIIIITTILLSTYPTTAFDHARAYCFRFRIGYPPDGYIIAPTDFCFPASYNIITYKQSQSRTRRALYIVYDYGRRDGFIITRSYTSAGHTRYTIEFIELYILLHFHFSDISIIIFYTLEKIIFVSII